MLNEFFSDQCEDVLLQYIENERYSAEFTEKISEYLKESGKYGLNKLVEAIRDVLTRKETPKNIKSDDMDIDDLSSEEYGSEGDDGLW